MNEVELKLEIAADDAPRLLRSEGLRELSCGRGRSRSLHTIYFDTPRLALAQRGIALRVRRDGRRLVQTLKIRNEAKGAHFDRLELEAPATSESPDLGLLPDPELRALVEEVVAGAPLSPVFETRFRRTLRPLRHSGSLVELDLDVGEIRAGGERQPICEVELELREGEPAALYEVALALLTVVPLRISTISKADQGYACLTGVPPAPSKAKSPVLPHDATLDEAIASTLASCFDQVLANQAPAHLGSSVEGVHQMRVGVRRLRSALSLFRSVLPADALRPLERELAWLARELGRVRDLDVFVVELLDPRIARRPGDKPLELLRDAAEVQRQARHDHLRRAIDSTRYTRLVLELGHWLARRGWREQPVDERSARLFAPARHLAGELLGRRHRKVHWLGDHLAELSVPELHRLRIQLKRLRYAGELLGALYPDRAQERYLEPVAELQDRLGGLADLATARGLLADLTERVDRESRAACAHVAGFVEGWASADAARGMRRLAKAWRSFERARPFWKQD